MKISSRIFQNLYTARIVCYAYEVSIGNQSRDCGLRIESDSDEGYDLTSFTTGMGWDAW